MIPLLVFLVLLTNKLDGSIRISYFAACSPLFLTFFTLVITSFGSRGGNNSYQLTFVFFSSTITLIINLSLFPGNQYWFGLRKPPCQFLFSVCPCLQLFGNISYSLYSDHSGSRAMGSNSASTPSTTESSGSSEVSVVDLLPSHSSLPPHGGKKCPGGGLCQKGEHQHIVVPALAIEMPD